MGMDLLRSCYSTRMRNDPANPTKSSPVTWYFCPPGAAVFPGAHSFGSLNWYKGQGLPDAPIGEISSAARPWSNGATPAESTGKKLCAAPASFLTGLPYLLSPRSEYPDGFPMCCNVIDTGLFLDAGLAFSGYFCQGNPIPTFQIVIKVATPTGSPWAPFVGQSYSLLYIPNSFPPTYVNAAAGGGLGLTMHMICASAGQGWFLRAGGGSAGDTGPQYPVLTVGETFSQFFPGPSDFCTFEVTAF